MSVDRSDPDAPLVRVAGELALTIEVTRIEAGRARLRLTGELEYDSAPDLIAAVAELRRDGHQELVIDLAGVSLCDSSGLSALLVAHQGGTAPTRLAGVNPQLQQMLDRTGLAELLAVERATGDDLRATG